MLWSAIGYILEQGPAMVSWWGSAGRPREHGESQSGPSTTRNAPPSLACPSTLGIRMLRLGFGLQEAARSTLSASGRCLGAALFSLLLSVQVLSREG